MAEFSGVLEPELKASWSSRTEGDDRGAQHGGVRRDNAR